MKEMLMITSKINMGLVLKYTAVIHISQITWLQSVDVKLSL